MVRLPCACRSLCKLRVKFDLLKKENKLNERQVVDSVQSMHKERALDVKPQNHATFV